MSDCRLYPEEASCALARKKVIVEKWPAACIALFLYVVLGQSMVELQYSPGVFP